MGADIPMHDKYMTMRVQPIVVASKDIVTIYY